YRFALQGARERRAENRRREVVTWVTAGLVGRRIACPLRARCSEQNRRKAVTQSYGATADSSATLAGPPAIDAGRSWRPVSFPAPMEACPCRSATSWRTDSPC